MIGTEKQIACAKRIIAKVRKNLDLRIYVEKSSAEKIRPYGKCHCYESHLIRATRAKKCFHAVDKFHGHASHIITAAETDLYNHYIDGPVSRTKTIPIPLSDIIKSEKLPYKI